MKISLSLSRVADRYFTPKVDVQRCRRSELIYRIKIDDACWMFECYSLRFSVKYTVFHHCFNRVLFLLA